MCGISRNNNREDLRGRVQFMIMEVEVSQERAMIKENKRLNWEHKNLQGFLLSNQAMIPRILFSQPPVAHTAEESNVGKFTPTQQEKKSCSLGWQNVTQFLASCFGLAEFGERKFELLGKSIFFSWKADFPHEKPWSENCYFHTTFYSNINKCHSVKY